MILIKDLFKRTIFTIIIISTLITFLTTPSSYAKLELEEGEFYYAGSTEGSYVPSVNIFAWLLNCLGDIADWLLGILTLGIRMVIVGWTALLEKILTWSLESTTGLSAGGGAVGSDLSSISDSSNNVTIEAIVYNKVAGLDIDFFNLEFDRATSGTGQKFYCRKCKMNVDECMPNAKDMITPGMDVEDFDMSLLCNNTPPADTPDTPSTPTTTLTTETSTSVEQNSTSEEEAVVPAVPTCHCNGCEACKSYVQQLALEEPMIIKIRKLVAIWYYIMLLLAAAAMLVALIAIGIKMAISTIASDKAVYKRMLVDWVVGAIIIFTIHYFMILVIHLNGIIVGVIRDSSNAINQVQMKQLSESETEKSSQDIEISVYQEVKTRAYDPKLINGTIGMIMYLMLVFYAFKYTVIYLKRFFTIMVLTLMGPFVGVAYALQRVMTGKGSSLSTWIKEYIFNVIIQIVHALMYAIFISQALVLALESVSGMILALLLINYVSKADKLFKKIFEFGGGGSLANETDNAMESAKSGINKAINVAAGAKALTSTPYAKAVKGLGKAAGKATVALGIGLGAGAYKAAKSLGPSDEVKFERAVEKEMDKNGEGYAFKRHADGSDAETEEQYRKRRGIAEEAVYKRMSKGGSIDLDDQVLERGGSRLRSELESASNKLKSLPEDATEEERKAAQQEHAEAQARFNRFQQITTPSTSDKLKGHIKRTIDMENVFENTTTKNPLKLAWTAAFGKTTFNPKTMKFENDGKGIADQLSISNLFGITDKDKKMMKATASDILQGFWGMGLFFAGMGNIVSNPTIGMALLTKGAKQSSKMLGKNPKLSNQKGKYTFSRFGSQSLDSIRSSAIARAQQEQRAMIASAIASGHPELAESLRNGSASAKTIGKIGGELGTTFATQNSPYSDIATMALISKYGTPGTRFMRNTALGGKMDEFAMHCMKQQRQQIAEFNNEVIQMRKDSVEASIEYRNEKHLENPQQQDEEFLKVLEEQGYAIDQYGDVVEVDKSKSDELEDIFTQILLDSERENNETGENVTKETIAKKYDIDSIDLVSTETESRISQADVDFVNKTIDNILIQVSAGKSEIDLTSGQTFGMVTDLLSAELQKSGMISEDKSADVVFKDGQSGLKAAVKKKGAKINAAREAAKKKVEEAYAETGKKVDAKDVLSSLQKDRDGAVRAMSSDGSQRVAGSDGSRKVGGNQPNEKQKDAIDVFAYVTTGVPPKKGKKVEGSKSEDVIKQAREKVANEKEKNMSKLEEAINVMIGFEQEPETQERVLADLSEGDRDYVTATVRDLLELKEINMESQRLNRDKIPGGKALRALRAESDSRINIATYEKQKIMEEMSSKSDGEKKIAIDELNQKLKTEKAKLKEAEYKSSMVGPVTDVPGYVKNMYERPKKGKKDD